VSPKVAPLRINLKALILLQAKISPCGRDDSFLNYDTVSKPE